MKTKLYMILLAMFIFALPAFGADAPAGTTNWVPVAACFAMAIAAAGCALGMGRAIGSAAEGMARNPGASDAIRGALILGLVLIESLALYVIVIIFTR
jgi:F-type H+-transporting ATPase subunit c